MISSICFAEFSIFSITYLMQIVMQIGLQSKVGLFYFLPPILTLILSIYSAYFTLINRTFTTLYNQKEGISDFSKRVFKVSLAFFVLVTGTMTVLDLKYLRLF